jgi:hypothetical protein
VLKASSKTVHVHCLLRRFCEIYLAGYEAATVNLLRKWFHTEFLKVSNRKKCLEIIGRVTHK